MCPGADSVAPFQLSFGLDEGGEIYLMTTTAEGFATVYQLADPARYIYSYTVLYAVSELYYILYSLLADATILRPAKRVSKLLPNYLL